MGKIVKLYVCMGLPASGKSTWVKDKIRANPNVVKRVNKDDIRAMVGDGMWNKNLESFYVKIEDNIIIEGLNSGKDVIVDDTNLNPVHFKRFRSIIRDCKNAVEIEFKIFDTDIETCIERDKLRSPSVGEDVIRGMAKKWLKDGKIVEPKFEVVALEPYTQDPALPHVIIVDIDGTVALKHPDRGHFDWKKVGLDYPNQPIVDIIKSLSKDVKIIFMSGRDGSCRNETMGWLKAIFGVQPYLFMRTANDNRKDSIIKYELWEEHIKNQYYVRAVFDDRNSVCDMWRKRLGLTVCQVNYGNF